MTCGAVPRFHGGMLLRRCPHGTWEIAHELPHPALRTSVRHYRGYRISTGLPRSRRELPHGEVTLVLGFTGELRIWTPDRGPAEPTRHGSLLTGLRTDTVIGRHDGGVSGVEIVMSPWSAFTMFGVDMHELAFTHTDPFTLPGRSLRPLADALANTPGWAARFALLDRELTHRLAAGSGCAPQALRAWRLLLGSGGTTPVSVLAAEVGWSRRRLSDAFKEQLGLMPKAIGRVIRLQHSLRLLTSGVAPARVAAECGFYDQSHLAQEFQRMVGCTPGGFLAARRADAAGPPVEDRSRGKVTSVLAGAL